ncbi:MAG: hypothetical protein Q4A31_00555 [Corynebacterium sp.]|uniref:hypothetical protein n=1 Tax=Corynebacterium sp. TaxID=1720 RepID=UPI0026DA89B3|nr:hypothetical protein [Corynebacterium sp.]MDO4760399.1 hypothetical protein [Corynebacterium sp.]
MIALFGIFLSALIRPYLGPMLVEFGAHPFWVGVGFGLGAALYMLIDGHAVRQFFFWVCAATAPLLFLGGHVGIIAGLVFAFASLSLLHMHYAAFIGAMSASVGLWLAPDLHFLALASIAVAGAAVVVRFMSRDVSYAAPSVPSHPLQENPGVWWAAGLVSASVVSFGFIALHLVSLHSFPVWGVGLVYAAAGAVVWASMRVGGRMGVWAFVALPLVALLSVVVVLSSQLYVSLVGVFLWASAVGLQYVTVFPANLRTASGARLAASQVLGGLCGSVLLGSMWLYSQAAAVIFLALCAGIAVVIMVEVVTGSVRLAGVGPADRRGVTRARFVDRIDYSKPEDEEGGVWPDTFRRRG